MVLSLEVSCTFPVLSYYFLDVLMILSKFFPSKFQVFLWYFQGTVPVCFPFLPGIILVHSKHFASPLLVPTQNFHAYFLVILVFSMFVIIELCTYFGILLIDFHRFAYFGIILNTLEYTYFWYDLHVWQGENMKMLGLNPWHFTTF